jgi:flagellar assembly protein FliH
MKSSAKSILKQAAVAESGQAKAIITKQPLKNQSADKTESLWLKDGTLNPQTKLISPEKQLELKSVRQQIIDQAKKDAERLKQQGYQTGEADGQKAGYQAGYQKGLSAGQQAAEKLTAQAEKNMQTAMTTTRKYVLERKRELMQFVIKMAETLVKKELDQDPTAINAILQPILLQMQQPAHPRYHQQLERQMKLEKQKLPGFRYLILDDADKSAYQVSVESDEGVTTFDLSKELERFLKQAER